MRWFRFAVLVLLASILQTGPVSMLTIRADIRPDLLLILLVFFALRSNSTDAVIASFAIGFVADLSMSNSTLSLIGPHMVSFGLFGTLLADLNSTLYVRRPLYQALTIFLMSCLTTGLACLLTLLRARTVTLNVPTAFLWQPLYSALLGPLVFLPVGWWMHMAGKSRRRSPSRALLGR
jgi:rod shape-determining protein MreD